MLISEKYEKLVNYLKSLESVVVAFSGGVDSTFLLNVAKEVLGDRVLAVTIASPYIPRWEIEEAKEICSKYSVEHDIIEAGIAPEIHNNPSNRCYLCKKVLFTAIKELAEHGGYKHVIDGSNMDDLGDYRPGMKALKELEIISPMLVAKLTKADIRELSKEKGLPTWDKPAYACLLTRIPYDTELKAADFRLIEKAEKYMMNLGFKAVRVRKHGKLARIEVSREKRKELFDEKLFDEISAKLKEFGFEYVTLDMQGYKMGSLNGKLNDPANK